MPWGDGTGPWGIGPMTGRRAGYCAGYPVPGYLNPIPGFGRGFWGRGFGRGRGFWWRRFYPFPAYFRPMPYTTPARYYYAPNPQISEEEEKKYLEDMIKGLEEELKAVKERFAELSK